MQLRRGLPVSRQTTNSKTGRARLLLYAIVFPGALALDVITPLGVADWLLVLILVGIACCWGHKREVVLVTVFASAAILIGLWSSPAGSTPFLMGALNRFFAVLVAWAMVYASLRFASGRPKPALIPMCAGCKSIRTQAGDWQELECYLLANSNIRFAHTLCPPCADRYSVDI